MRYRYLWFMTSVMWHFQVRNAICHCLVSRFIHSFWFVFGKKYHWTLDSQSVFDIQFNCIFTCEGQFKYAVFFPVMIDSKKVTIFLSSISVRKLCVRWHKKRPNEGSEGLKWFNSVDQSSVLRLKVAREHWVGRPDMTLCEISRARVLTSHVTDVSFWERN